MSLFIPRDDGGFAECIQYDVNVNSVITQIAGQAGHLNDSIIRDLVARSRWPTKQCADGWDYDTEHYPETLASKVQ